MLQPTWLGLKDPVSRWLIRKALAGSLSHPLALGGRAQVLIMSAFPKGGFSILRTGRTLPCKENVKEKDKIEMAGSSPTSLRKPHFPICTISCWLHKSALFIVEGDDTRTQGSVPRLASEYILHQWIVSWFYNLTIRGASFLTSVWWKVSHPPSPSSTNL